MSQVSSEHGALKARLQVTIFSSEPALIHYRPARTVLILPRFKSMEPHTGGARQRSVPCDSCMLERPLWTQKDPPIREHL